MGKWQYLWGSFNKDILIVNWERIIVRVKLDCVCKALFISHHYSNLHILNTVSLIIYEIITDFEGTIVTHREPQTLLIILYNVGSHLSELSPLKMVRYYWEIWEYPCLERPKWNLQQMNNWLLFVKRIKGNLRTKIIDNFTINFNLILSEYHPS